MTQKIDYQFDQDHIWHPYTSLTEPLPVYGVVAAKGCYLQLEDGSELVDGMSSWWSTLHGYNHPVLNDSMKAQIDKMAHVMFGGITHNPAIELSKRLVKLTPEGLDKIFISDSGSVAVEVSMKMALQYWHSQGKAEKSKFLALEKGYHGDTFAAMSVCDPITGMHTLFANNLQKQIFVERPSVKINQTWQANAMTALENTLKNHHHEAAALILEPVVQGTGGMYFYHPEYLVQARALCDKYDVLLIADEIATGFGRTGKLFACEWAGISPDILCLGKTLTGGMMSLAATLTTEKIATGICNGEAGVFMHGPTFMGNPLACATAVASIDLLLASDWQKKVAQLEKWLTKCLLPLKTNPKIADVRCLGAIGVVETHEPVNVAQIQKVFVEQGVWIRPFGKLVYIMPPYIAGLAEVEKLAHAIEYYFEQS
ncbi:adenosylmethionine--8-amino-7-oxononanoate transaminase [Catenovulum sp. SM1970]|uniref:adenosylmethionine--8-amino-7-oxononanoate transaminase n=1 Tax=Marinifaba aquimaris TaxID=2741323 RepID=UPI0015745DA2|nr:adenosylmethionine--8-amino-7-oxononanoate transaminase [Marinifaba aquimaris]NTS76016.1 adenosylmethionine--8-amino-7-oxononanoate transaminase [Marinifaba aquimaris]